LGSVPHDTRLRIAEPVRIPGREDHAYARPPDADPNPEPDTSQDDTDYYVSEEFIDLNLEGLLGPVPVAHPVPPPGGPDELYMELAEAVMDVADTTEEEIEALNVPAIFDFPEFMDIDFESPENAE
jgi:hypothetical protein